MPTCVHFPTSAVAVGAAAAEAAAVVVGAAAVFTTVAVVEAAAGAIPKLGMNSGTLGFRSGLIVVVFWLLVAVLDCLETEAAVARPLVSGAVVVAPVVCKGIGCCFGAASASRGQNVGFFFGRNCRERKRQQDKKT